MDDFGGVILGFFTLTIIFLSIASSFVFIGVDYTCNAEIIYPSLPIKRSIIVYGRYVSSFLLTSSSFLLAVLVCYIAVHVFEKTDPVFDIILQWRAIVSMVAFLFLIQSFILPFIFKFGAGRGINAAIVTQIVIVLMIPVVKFIMNAISGIFAFDLAFFSRLLQTILIWIIGLQTFYAYFLIFTFVISIIYISIRLSVRFFNRLEL